MLGGSRDVGSTAVPHVTRGLTLRFVLLTGMAVGLVALSALIQELQGASTAWIVGQSHWSRSQQHASFALERYLTSGNPAALAEARAALQVPLGDLDARRALEQDDVDVARARRGFLQGGNQPGDINRLILSFRYLGHLGYFRDAVHLWQQTDHGLAQLQAMMDTAEALHADGRVEPPMREALLVQLQALDRSLQAQARAFSLALLNTASIVRMATLIVGGLSVLLITLVAVLLSRRVRNDLIDTESRFRAAFYQATVGMLKLDHAGGIVEANQAMADILGYRRDALLGMELPELLVDGELVLDEAGDIDWPRQLRPGELRFRHADGGLLWGRWSGTLVRSPGRDVSVFAIIEDVSQNHALAREVEHHASHDPLTGLINRREIERLLELALLDVRAHGGTHSLCYLDLDYFKLVNDGLGHAAGDQLLRGFADYLEGAVREGDWVGRMGGDEFAMFLSDARQEEAKQVLQRIARNLGQAGFQRDDGLPRVSCSIGVVEITADVADVNWLMSAADSACYAAKQAGRNRVHCFNENRMALEERLLEADRLAHVSSAIAEKPHAAVRPAHRTGRRSRLPALRGTGAHARYRWPAAGPGRFHAGGGALWHGHGAGPARAGAAVPPPAAVPSARAAVGPVQRERIGPVDRRAELPGVRLRPARAQPGSGAQAVFRDHRDRGDQQPGPGAQLRGRGQGARVPGGAG